MGDSSSFFEAFHGLQYLKDDESQDYSEGKYEYCRLENLLKCCADVETAHCLLYLTFLKALIEKQIRSQSAEFTEETVYEKVVKLIKLYKEKKYFQKDIFARLPKNYLDKIEDLTQTIADKLPNDYFQKPRPRYLDDFNLHPYDNSRSQNPIFYIPLCEDIADIGKNGDRSENVEWSLKYSEKPSTNSSQKVALEEMFEVCKNSIPSYDFENFQSIIEDILASERNDEEVSVHLLDIFGYEVIDFVSEIVKNRHQLIRNVKQDATQSINVSKFTNRNTSDAIIAGTVTVQSEKENSLLKKLRKIEKKDRSKGSLSEFQETSREYEIAKTTPIFKKQAVQPLDKDQYPHVHDQMRNHMITAKFEGHSIMQPENAIKRATSDYVEFTIPGDGKDSIKDIDLVKVNSLDTVGQLVFKDIREFNRIQSEVFPVAYHSNENMLVCAPTGAGKTNIALLAICHQIKCHMDGSFIRKKDFKIVYVCPMKALATEIVVNFSKKLAPVGICVKECTGDMQLTKREIAEAEILVTTPEKWDVITRKGAVDSEVVGLVKLLIIDEVHLLNGSRGPVIEALVARTLRQVVSSQSMIRIVALSATLPGYLDVAQFLKVNTRSGLFFFDNRFRSVPLTTSFIGVKKKNESDIMDMVCYEKVVDFIRDGHQAMVFVTSRNATAAVAKKLIEIAQEKGTLKLFETERCLKANRSVFKTGDLDFLVPRGFGIHHAGMVRHDRLAIEDLFRTGGLKVIVCTTTLAWGVNLPAHGVIIRGTLHYDATQSAFVDMDMLDVQQIFGRAGRPQYDTSGHGIIITTMANMPKYMGLMLSQVPIESQFLNCVPDNLNAEIVLGTVSNLKEGVEWLANTFLLCRIKKNPLVYGLTFKEVFDTLEFNRFLQLQLDNAAVTLEKAHMIRFDTKLGELRPTNFGRISSFYYISYKTMEMFYQRFDRNISEANLLRLLSEAHEFQQIQVRADELGELDRLREYNYYNIPLDFANSVSKIVCLIQANISRVPIRISSLASDSQYIMQTVVRLARALFEIAKDKSFALQVSRTLKLAQMMEQQIWDDVHPLMQFKELIPHLTSHRAMEMLNLNIEDFKEMSERELESMFKARHVANRVKHYCNIFPTVDVDHVVKPITDGVIRIKLLITPTFKWCNQTHGNVQHYYAWVEDPSHDSIYHTETFVVTKKMCQPNADPIEIIFTVPLMKPLSLEYFVRVVNSQFLHAECFFVINLDDFAMLTSESFQTNILDLQPLPKQVLGNKAFEDLYPFTHFNAVQSQVFHSCYHTDTPIILGAPTGSGKTIVAELCILKLFQSDPTQKVVYIAPMKALVRERVMDWSKKFTKINKEVLEVTGDITPRSEFIRRAHIIITTPEKWDAMSRNWTEKDFVKQVGLMIIDEIHLLGEDRGPVLEAIVSRMNYINCKKNTNVRIVGLSTAMANPGDLAYWLNCEKGGIFNFSSAVRPVPLEIHLQGFEVKHYCPRMAAMNKSVYQAICQYASESSALIFVSSRKQTRITGYELMKYLLSESNPQKWMHCELFELEDAKARLIDQDLAHLLSYGIGMHHAGLCDSDRNLVEQLYVNQKIQVLIATATLAWGVNFPARLVIVKGTEYFDATTKRYVDMPITDVIQMCGRAGRPQFDNIGVACVMIQESKKNFYRKFLFEPFPVESNLLEFLPDHVNAEIANGNIVSKSQLLEFIESTFFFRRLVANPNYYQLETDGDPLKYIDDLANSVVQTLHDHDCVTTEQNTASNTLYETTFLGLLASQYYISYKSIYFLSENMDMDNSMDELLTLICQVEEYRLFPVRHNEDNINKDLARQLQIKTNFAWDSPFLKVLLMIKCYLLDQTLPNQEYVLDLKTALDQINRIIHAMIGLAAGRKWFDCTRKLIYLSQMIIQGFVTNKSNLIMLPHLTKEGLVNVTRKLSNILKINHTEISVSALKCSLNSRNDRSKDFHQVFSEFLGRDKSAEIMKVLDKMPLATIEIDIPSSSNTMKSQQNSHLSNEIHIKGGDEGQHMFKIAVSREGSSKTNVFSKKSNKQKEEIWFLILWMEDLCVFKRFNFNRKYKKFEIPVSLRKGRYDYELHLMNDCYIGLDQKISGSISIT